MSIVSVDYKSKQRVKKLGEPRRLIKNAGSKGRALWFNQNKKSALSGNVMSDTDDTYINGSMTHLIKEADADTLGYEPNGTRQAFLEARGYVKVDISDNLNKNIFVEEKIYDPQTT